MDRNRPIPALVFIAGSLAGSLAGAARLAAAPGDIVLPEVRTEEIGPQDVAIDPGDGTVWVTTALSGKILRFTAELKPLPSIDTPFESSLELSGIAFRSKTGTFLVINPVAQEMREITRAGAWTGFRVVLPLFPVPGLDPSPYAIGMGYQPDSPGSPETVWLLERRRGFIYRIDLAGTLIENFCHPSFPSACQPDVANALPSSGLDVRLGEGGAIEGLDLDTGAALTRSIIAVDPAGTPDGRRWTLLEAGGTPGGFARAEILHPQSGLPTPVYYVTVESSAEILAIEASPPPAREVLGLACEVSGSRVELSWRNGEFFEGGIAVYRNDLPVADLGGGDESFADDPAPPGVLVYRVAGRTAGGASASAECRAVVGAGQVIRRAPFAGRTAVDLTEDDRGNLYITDLANRIFVYGKDLLLRGEILSPFREPEDRTSGIAYSRSGDTLFVYNARTDRIAEIDLQGNLRAPPFPSGVLPAPQEEENAVAAMLFNPDRSLGESSLLFYEVAGARLLEIDFDGKVLLECPHPDAIRDPIPAGTPLITYGAGLSSVPGTGFTLLDLPGGTAREGKMSRIIRIDAAACGPTGFEAPLEGIEDAAGGRSVFQAGIHDAIDDGRPVAYVARIFPSPSELYEISLEPPPFLAPTEISCRQEGLEDRVEISFRNNGPYERLELVRDGAAAADLDPAASEAIDSGAEPGFHRYRLRAWRGAASMDSRGCGLQVGPGAMLARRISYPGTFLTAVARDPEDGSILCASRTNQLSGSYFRYRPDLVFERQIPAAFQLPFQTAGLAYRLERPGRKQIVSIGWEPGKTPGQQNSLPLRFQSPEGATTSETRTSPPVTSSLFVTFPVGLTWDSSDDTLWYLERNTRTIVHIDLEGRVLGHFPNPAHPHQDGVINFGLWADGARGLLYIGGAGRRDFQITRIFEMTRDGVLTGRQAPLDAEDYDERAGFAIEGSTAVVASRRAALPDLVRVKMFEDIPAPAGLGAIAIGRDVKLVWLPEPAYEGVEIWRQIAGDGAVIATLPGGAAEHLDTGLPFDSRVTYVVRGLLGGDAGPGSALSLVAARRFLRGDAEENGELNITDAITILEYLFLGGRAPACLDAADVDDSGEVDISDPIALLGFLFLTGVEPPAPHPAPGVDPTPDPLPCR